MSQNYNTYILYLYAIKHLPVKDKVRFYYGLKGRDGKGGIIAQHGVKQLARGALLVPEQQAEQVTAFLQGWQCTYKTREVLIRE